MTNFVTDKIIALPVSFFNSICVIILDIDPLKGHLSIESSIYCNSC